MKIECSVVVIDVMNLLGIAFQAISNINIGPTHSRVLCEWKNVGQKLILKCVLFNCTKRMSIRETQSIELMSVVQCTRIMERYSESTLSIYINFRCLLSFLHTLLTHNYRMRWMHKTMLMFYTCSLPFYYINYEPLSNV